MMKVLLVLAFVAAALCDNSTTTMAPAPSAGPPSMMCPDCKNMTEIKVFYDDYSDWLFDANVVVALQKADLFSQALPLYKRSLCYEVSLSNMTYKMIKTDRIVAKCELISFMTPTMSPTTTMASATTSNETMTTTTMNSTTTVATTTTVAATTEDANTTMSTDGNSTTAMPGNDTTAMPTTTMMAANTTTTMATPAPETGTMAHITGVVFYIKDILKTMYAHNYTCGEHKNETCEGFYISSVSMNKSILPPIPGKEVMDKIVCVNIVQPQSFNFSTIANFSALLTVEIFSTSWSVPPSSKCIMFDGTPNITYCTTILNGHSIRCKCDKLGIIGVAYDTPPPTTSLPTTTPVATTVNVNANTTATITNSTASSMMNTTVQLNTTVSMNVTTTTSTTETTVLPPTTPEGGYFSKMKILFPGNFSEINCTALFEALAAELKAQDSNFDSLAYRECKPGSIILHFFLILKDASLANASINNIGHQVKNGGFILIVNGETLTADKNGFQVDGQQYVVYATDPPTQPEDDDNDYIIVIIVVTIILVLGIIIIIVVVYIVRDKSKQKVKPDSRKN